MSHVDANQHFVELGDLSCHMKGFVFSFKLKFGT